MSDIELFKVTEVFFMKPTVTENNKYEQSITFTKTRP